MFKAYKISKTEIRNHLPTNLTADISIEKPRKEYLLQKLESMMLGAGNCLDGEQIRKDWFPENNLDVFISHSSKDVHEAERLSSWLFNEFGIQSFIDSQFWEHSDVLLKKIDDKYCLSNKSDKKTYSYEKRNISTAHVHMILSYALAKMIEKAECFIFIDSENSISIDEAINSTTYSPWIFYELMIAQTITLQPHKRGLIKSSTLWSEDFKLKHPVLSDRLKTTLESKTLSQWSKATKQIDNRNHHPLDILYSIVENDI